MRIHRSSLAFFAIEAALFLFLNSSAVAQLGATQNATVALDRGWQFRQVSTSSDLNTGWMPATVPGDVHLDLLANKKIPDPFYRDNESKLQWIQDESWEYRVSFDVSPAQLARSHVDLVFDGLDATANVYLNGTQVLTADNMFRAWRVPAKAVSACRQQSTARRLSIADQGRGRGCGTRSLAAAKQKPLPRPTCAKQPMNTDGTGARHSSPAASGVPCASKPGTRSASPTSPSASAT